MKLSNTIMYNVPEHSLFASWKDSMFQNFLEAGQECFSLYNTTYLSSNKEFAQFILDRGYKKLYTMTHQSSITCLFQKEKNFVNVTMGVTTEIDAIFTNESELEIFQKFINENKSPSEMINQKGSVYVLVQTRTGFEPQFLGQDYCPLVRENYASDVLESYDRTIDAFSSEDGKYGFISIFSGPPGTGKSFLIRSLIGSIKDSIFLYIPASMISSLSSHLLGVLRDLSEEINEPTFEDEADVSANNKIILSPETIDKYWSSRRQSAKNPKKNKIVLILEDADEVLAPRRETDMAGISSLLNLTDGLLGKILNIRIIATTNSPSKEIDKAITRPGRLCTHCIVGALSPGHAKEIFAREGGKGNLYDQPYSLAEIYKYAREGNIPQPERKIGF